MQKRLSFKEALARQGETPAPVPVPSGSPVSFYLTARDVQRPVDAIRVLASCGLGLRRGHAVFGRLFTSAGTAVELIVADGRDVVAELAMLGVSARPLKRPDVEVATVRKKVGLSQAEFATRFGLELATIQNWEQGRNRPDPAAMILLKIIDQNPGAVDAALAG